VQHRFGDVERASRAFHVERLVFASMVEDEQVGALHEGDGHVAHADHLVDLGVGHVPFAQSRVRTLIAGSVEMGVLGPGDRGDGTLHYATQAG
jgi:hypothetical protein